MCTQKVYKDPVCSDHFYMTACSFQKFLLPSRLYCRLWSFTRSTAWLLNRTGHGLRSTTLHHRRLGISPDPEGNSNMNLYISYTVNTVILQVFTVNLFFILIIPRLLLYIDFHNIIKLYFRVIMQFQAVI